MCYWAKGLLPNMHLSQYYGIGFCRNKNFIARWRDKETRGMAQICSLNLRFHQTCMSSERRVGMWKCWRGRFLLEGFGMWPFMLRYGKGDVSPRSSWTTEPSILKGFQCSGSDHVLVLWFLAGGECGVEILVPGVVWSRNFLLCTCFSCLTCSFVLLSLKSNSVSC